MNKFVISTTKDNVVINSSDQSIIYIFENVKGYEDEIYDLFLDNKMSIPQLENMINSWGGKLKTVTLKQLINNLKKDLVIRYHLLQMKRLYLIQNISSNTIILRVHCLIF